MQRRHFVIAGRPAGRCCPRGPITAGAASTSRGRCTWRARPARSPGATRTPSSSSSCRPSLKLPADLAQRQVPAQTAPVDGPKLLAQAQLPTRKDKVWEIELAPLTRLQAWQVAEIKPGTDVAVLGFTFNDEKGEPVLRAEYLWVGGKAYGLRSSPA